MDNVIDVSIPVAQVIDQHPEVLVKRRTKTDYFLP